MNKKGELTKSYFKTDVTLLADTFESFIYLTSEVFDISPPYCVSLPGYTSHCGMKYIDIRLQTLHDDERIFLLENKIRGGISSVMSDR